MKTIEILKIMRYKKRKFETLTFSEKIAIFKCYKFNFFYLHLFLLKNLIII